MFFEAITDDNYIDKIRAEDGDIFMFMREAIFDWTPFADKVFKAYREIHGNHKYLCFLSEVRISELAEIEPLDASPERIQEFRDYRKYKYPEVMYDIEILLSSTIDRLTTLLSKMYTYGKLGHIFLIHDDDNIYAYTFDFGLDSIVVNGKQLRCHLICNNMRLPAVHCKYTKIDVVYRKKK